MTITTTTPPRSTRHHHHHLPMPFSAMCYDVISDEESGSTEELEDQIAAVTSNAIDPSIKKLIEKCAEYAKCQVFRLEQYKKSCRENDRKKRTAYKTFFVGGRLRSHQKFGLQWYRTLFANEINGILADEMGLGKTVQTVAFVCDVLAKESRGPFLVLCPLSVLGHWVKEFATFAPGVRLVTVTGSKEERAASKSKFSRSWTSNRIPKIQVLLTTYEIILRDRTFFKRSNWKVLFVDEGHRLKNSQSKLLAVLKTLNTRSRFILSGTPLQNKLEELWTLLEFLMPQVFKSANNPNFQAVTKRLVESKKRSFHQDEWSERSSTSMLQDEPSSPFHSVPAPVANNWIPEMVNTIHKVVSPFILRRLKVDIEGLNIPPKVVRTIELEMTKDQKKLQQYFLAPEVIERWGLTRIWSIIRRLAVHPRLVDRYVDDMSGCSHPAFPRLIKENHRTLIFGQLLDALDIIERFCVNTLKVQVCRIDGKMPCAKREEQLEKFNKREAGVMLLSTRAAGLDSKLLFGKTKPVGGNPFLDDRIVRRNVCNKSITMTSGHITAADTVIIFESDYNPMIDEQAQDRCHRIGQTNTVLVLRLRVTPSPYETLVSRLAMEKISMGKQVIGPLRGTLKGYELSSVNGDRRELRAVVDDQIDCIDTHFTEGEVVKFNPDSKDFLRKALCRFSK
ncbi:hypothetical protein ACOME3_009770 [Neoechinorhynchus agilis]